MTFVRTSSCDTVCNVYHVTPLNVLACTPRLRCMSTPLAWVFKAVLDSALLCFVRAPTNLQSSHFETPTLHLRFSLLSSLTAASSLLCWQIAPSAIIRWLAVA